MGRTEIPGLAGASMQRSSPIVWDFSKDLEGEGFRCKEAEQGWSEALADGWNGGGWALFPLEFREGAEEAVKGVWLSLEEARTVPSV